MDQLAKLGASDLPRVSNVIGVYADPAAETDDWADDFILEQGHSPSGDSSESRTVDDESASFLSWLQQLGELWILNVSRGEEQPVRQKRR